MKAASTTRMIASALSIVSYVLLTHGHQVEGVSVNLVVQGLLVPFALQTHAYDMVTLSGVFGVINIKALLSHLS